MVISDHSASMMWDPPVRGARLKADVYVVHIHRLPRGDNTMSEISHGLGRPALEHLLFLGPIDTQLMTSGIYLRLVEAVDGPVN